MPVLLEGIEETAFPSLLQGRVYADFRKAESYYATLFDLILSLYRCPSRDPAAEVLRKRLNGPVPLAVVFTDVAGSTAKARDIREQAMNDVRRAHFAQSRKLIAQFQGREIKTLGDSFMAAFHCADSALDYALALQRETGHPRVSVRAGIHIGPLHAEESDVFGGTVNFAARVGGAIHDAEIWLSERAKDDIERLGADKYQRLDWRRHENVAMEAFPGKFTLWAVRPI